jgi:hypothetical protein
MNQYDIERASLKKQYQTGELTYAEYQVELCLLECEERQDPAACIECNKRANAKIKRQTKRKIRS